MTMGAPGLASETWESNQLTPSSLSLFPAFSRSVPCLFPHLLHLHRLRRGSPRQRQTLFHNRKLQSPLLRQNPIQHDLHPIPCAKPPSPPLPHNLVRTLA